MEPYELLEKELAEWSGMPHVVCCSSGTAALHLALEVLQLPKGSKVIVPDFTMIACPRAVTLAGLEPVFVDCDSRLLMNPNLVRAAKAIMVVHIYGRRCDMEVWGKWAGTMGVFSDGRPMTPDGGFLIEDLAEAHGVKPHAMTDAACWSFYKNKIIAGEEGGAVGFRNPKHAALARQLRSLGFTDDHDFTHVPRGHNYRLSNANAKEILGTFDKGYWRDPNKWQYWWENRVDHRREIESWYDELCPVEYKMPPRDAPWVYDLRIPGMMPLRQIELVKALQAEGIVARHAFKPMSQQEEYRHCPVYGNGNAAVASREVIYLPLTPGKVTRSSCEKAFEIIKRVVGDWTTMK